MIDGSFVEVDGVRVLEAAGEELAVSASNRRVDVDAGMLLRLATNLSADGGFTINGDPVEVDLEDEFLRYVHPLLTDSRSGRDEDAEVASISAAARLHAGRRRR